MSDREVSDATPDSWLTPALYQRLCALVEQAGEHPRAERRSFLAAACGGDERLRVEALAMIEADEALEKPEPGFVPAGTRIGPYRIDRELGCGGMGAVYLASRADDSYDQQVAIKVIRPDVDNEEILARFSLERRILASLEHPNIARIVDGGAMDDGRPYLVMEYVDGVPMTAYADRARLPIRERIALFRTVCAAVDHAHQKLVVHRDLKPSNILVTAAGVPKLLDFGIAKVLTSGGQAAARLTATNLRPGTPLYASPEQFAGELVSTTADVYALGVVLFELLTGQWPFEPNAPRAARGTRRPSVAVSPWGGASAVAPDARLRLSPTAMAAARSTTPAQLEQRLRGDLDAVVMTAICDNVHQRYRSVAELSDDLQRHLDGLPVVARPGTITYRAARFARRHRAALAAAVLVVVTLVGGIVSTYHQWQRAETERRRAERRFESVRSLASSVIDVSGTIRTAGSEPAQQALVLSSLKYLERLETEASGDPRLLSEISAGYRRVGDVQRESKGSGTPDAALASYRRAVSVSEKVVTAKPQNVEARRDLAQSYERVGTLLAESGENEAGGKNLERSLQLYEEVLIADRASATAQRDLMLAHLRYADAVVATDPAAAKASFEEARQIAESLVKRDSENLEARRDLVVTSDRLRDFEMAADPEKMRVEEATNFDAVKDTQDPDRLEYFLARFPNGPHATEARRRLNGLRTRVPRSRAAQAPGTEQTVVADPNPVPATTELPPPSPSPSTPGVDVSWKAIPAGRFEMGCDLRPDRVCNEDERPRHWITISRPFQLMATEATLGQYRAYAQASGRTLSVQPAWNNNDRFPIVNVTWDEARMFCEAVGGRLPTEAEWEWAALGGRTGSLYPWGDTFDRSRANAGFPGGDGWQRTAPVGTFPPNGYGLSDMAGNVWEWVSDWYGAQYYQQAPEPDPTGPSGGPSRVLRGGAYSVAPSFLRLTQRGTASHDRRRDATGVRCAR